MLGAQGNERRRAEPLPEHGSFLRCIRDLGQFRYGKLGSPHSLESRSIQLFEDNARLLLAHHRTVFGLHQGIVIAVARSRLGELDVKFVEELRHPAVDVFRAIGETRQELGQHRQEVSLRNPLTGGHQLPLGNPIDRVDMVDPLDAIEIALMDAIDADEVRAALGVWGRRSPMGTCVARVLVQCWRRVA